MSGSQEPEPSDKERDLGTWTENQGPNVLVPSPGTRMGPYRILRELGRGGQGLVFLAEDERLGRQVALKILTGWQALAPGTVARFQREAILAARLEHPAICSVYDAGMAQGVPFIAMRYVDGESLASRIAMAKGNTDRDLATLHLNLSQTFQDEPEGEDEMDSDRARSLSWQDLRATLEIIRTVAQGLHVAHEGGVVHRDVKPANIMLTQDGDPVILDFGLAYDGAHDQSALTATGSVFGTPHYMSPEQTVEAGKVDRRTDVYALGVTLYECLTLSRPFDAPTRERLFDAIRHQPVPDPRARNSHISRDLRVVLETAMDKDPNRRYQTAAAFSDDLGRVLLREPVQARPVPPWVRMTRWAQRHPAVALSSAGVFLAVSAGLWASLHLLNQTRQALGGEQAARQEAEAVVDFLVETLASPQPGSANADLTMRGFLETASGRIEDAFSDRPGVKARLEETVGLSYRSLGAFRESIQWMDRARESRSQTTDFRKEDADRLAVYRALAQSATGDVTGAVAAVEPVLQRMKDEGEAESLLAAYIYDIQSNAALARADYAACRALRQHCLAIRQSHLKPLDPSLLETVSSLAFIEAEMGHVTEAEEHTRRALALSRVVHGGPHADQVVLMNQLGLLLHRSNKVLEAEEQLLESLEVARKVFPPQHPKIADTLWRLGSAIQQKGRPDLALPMLEQALEIRRHVYENRHWDVAVAISSVAGCQAELRQMDQARKLYEEALELRYSLFGEHHVTIASSLQDLGDLERKAKDPRKAEEYFRAALEMFDQIQGTEAPSASSSRLYLALALQDQGRFDEAEVLFREVLALREKNPNTTDADLSIAYNNVGSILGRQQKWEESLTHLHRGLELRRKFQHAGHPHRLESLGNIGFVHTKLGQHEEAEAFLREEVEGWSGQPMRHRGRMNVARRFADNLYAQRKDPEAIRFLEAAIDGWDSDTSPGDPFDRQRLVFRLGRVRGRAGPAAVGESLMIEAYEGMIHDQPEAARQVATALADFYDGQQRPEDAALWRKRGAASG